MRIPKKPHLHVWKSAVDAVQISLGVIQDGARNKHTVRFAKSEILQNRQFAVYISP
jgi:hypothetical protein